MRLGDVPQIEALVVMKDVKPLTVDALATLQASKPFEKLEKAEQAGWLALLRKHFSETLPYTWRTPLERLGQPDDISGVVSFLAGPDGGWINGQILRPNGGLV
jgi:NAD(P)-dependent dehydrogenase (short-subunit alcohol dehydrogenase family)